MAGTEQILRPFATEMRHLTSALNVIASDMIRDRGMAKKIHAIVKANAPKQEIFKGQRPEDLGSN